MSWGRREQLTSPAENGGEDSDGEVLWLLALGQVHDDDVATCRGRRRRCDCCVYNRSAGVGVVVVVAVRGNRGSKACAEDEEDEDVPLHF